MLTAETQESTMSQEQDPSEEKCCCVKMFHYGGVVEAKGYALNAMGRGAAVMSNGENSFA
jgi:hypothetical protein